MMSKCPCHTIESKRNWQLNDNGHSFINEPKLLANYAALQNSFRPAKAAGGQLCKIHVCDHNLEDFPAASLNVE